MKEEKSFYIPDDGKGCLLSIAAEENITDNYRSILMQIVEDILEETDRNVESIVLRGSLAYGGFIEGISDLDLVIFPAKNADLSKERLGKLAAEESQRYKELFSLVDLSVEQIDRIGYDWTCNRLWLNLKLTGITIYGEDLLKNLPVCIKGKGLSDDIFRQTIKDSEECLEWISQKKKMHYMGEERGADFLCVWFMRNIIRGFGAVILQKKNIFTMHLTTCCLEMSKLYPEYEELILRVWTAERSPLKWWDELLQLCQEVLDMYRSLYQL